MATDIDTLQIEINAQAAKANDAIDKLVGKIGRLSTALSGLDSSNLGTLANGVSRLGIAMQTMNGVKTADFTRLAKNLEKLGNIDSSKLGTISSDIDKLNTALSGLTSVGDAADQLSKIATAIKQLGYKSAEKAIKNIPDLATAMYGLMSTLSAAPKVSQNLIDMTDALARLARTGASSGRAVISLNGALNGYSTSAKKAKNHSFNLASAIGKVYATYWMLFRALGKAKESIDLASDLTEVQNVVDVTFGKYAGLVEKMSETSIADFGMSELTVKEVSSRFQAMGTAMGFTQGKMADMSIELTKLTADMASFYNAEQKDVAQDLESVFTGQTRPLRQYGLDLTEATLKEWAMKNGLDADIKSMSQAEKTMLRYQYVMANTSNAQGDFAKTAGTWANQTRILKQNIEALGSAIGKNFIYFLKPVVSALNVVMGKLREFAKVVSNSLGVIFGWKYEESSGGMATDFEDAESAAGGIADATGDAAKNAAKIQKSLRAFDELNVISIQDSNSSGGSSGSSSSSSGSGSDGGWTKTESIIKSFESELDTLYKLGEYIGDKITSALEGIDWESVYAGAKNFGKGLADFLNGLISPKMFGAVGKTIAGALNTAINAAFSFADTFDFYELGKSVGTAVSDFFKNFDWKKFAKSMNKWVDGFRDTVSGFFGALDWGKIILSGLEFIGSLELDTISFTVLGYAFKNTVGVTKKAVLSAIGKALATTIGGSFTVGNALTLTLSASIIAAYTISTTIEKFGTKTWAEQLQGNDTSSGTPVPDTDSTLALISEIEEKWSKFKKWWKVNNKLDQPYFTNAGTTVPGHESALGIGETLKKKWEKTKNWWKKNNELYQPVFTNSGTTISGHESVLNMKEAIQEKWDEVKNWWKNNVKLPQINVPNIGDIRKAISDKWASAREWWNEKKGSLNSVSVTVSDIKAKISEKWDQAKTWWNEKGSLAKIDAKIANFKEKLSNAWDSVKKWWDKNKPSLSEITAKIKLPHLSVTWDTKGTAAKALQKLGLKGFPNFSVKYYANGGFPEEDGWFRANHGEIMGRFDNGKSVVANNKHITAGIAQAVYEGNREVIGVMRQELVETRKQNEILTQILAKEFGITKEEIGKAARSYANDYFKRTGREAYSF